MRYKKGNVIRMKTIRVIFVATISFILISCSESSDSAYNRGYDDGYAVGYNSTCNIRSTMVSGDWDNKHYSEGYADGTIDGSRACLNQN